MITLKKLLEINPFSVELSKKKIIFLNYLDKLNKHHYKKSSHYKKIVDFMGYESLKKKKIEDLPYLPIRLFKKFDLLSIRKQDIFKILNSSGTSNSSPSKIYLDKENANIQIKVLNKIISGVLGNERMPMLIIDYNPKNFNRSKFNARLAAIHGFSIFGKDYTYILNKNGKINYKILNNFLKKFSSKPFFIFGFTSFVYQNLILKMDKKKIDYNLSNGILIHGGGWKKMEKQKIDNLRFKKELYNKMKLHHVFNYYGLVEQTGSIYIECPTCNTFVTSIFSDVFIRDKNFKLVENGVSGLVQLISLLPTSYPGHNILTDDLGEIVKNKNKRCKLKGKHFLIHGRIKNSEIRGCSDV